MNTLTDGEANIWRTLFDFWRESYSEWPYESHQRFYNMVAEAFPEQRKYNLAAVIDAVSECLQRKNAPITVWELGGWDGELGNWILLDCDGQIEQWRNNEISQSAVDKLEKRHPNYFGYCPHDWVWRETDVLKGWDIAIMSHVIEHLSWDHLTWLLIWLRRVPYLYFQTPQSLGEENPEKAWMGTMSTHKLEVGWEAIRDLVVQLDYEEQWQQESPTSGVARLYCKSEAWWERQRAEA